MAAVVVAVAVADEIDSVVASADRIVDDEKDQRLHLVANIVAFK